MFLFCFIFYQITAINNAIVTFCSADYIFVSFVSIIYANIHRRKFVDNVFYFHILTPLTTIMMLGISIVLFSGKSLSALNLLLI